MTHRKVYRNAITVEQLSFATWQVMELVVHTCNPTGILQGNCAMQDATEFFFNFSNESSSIPWKNKEQAIHVAFQKFPDEEVF